MTDSAQGEQDRKVMQMGEYLIVAFSKSSFQLNEIVTTEKVY